MQHSDEKDAAQSASATTAASSAMAFDTLTTLSAPPTSDNNNGILLLGKLLRRDRRLFTWKWRDFVLERSRLQYFSRKGNRKGDIPLTPHTPITIRMCNEPKPFGFLLFIKDTKLTLAASTERERHQWIDVFCDVFHASVEQTPADTKAERRAKPTYLPIPDLGDDGLNHNSSASNLLVPQISSLEHPDAGDGGHVTPIMAQIFLDTDHGNKLKRDSFGEDVIPILESRMTYGPLKEMYSRIIFPPSLANGDLLVGVGPIVRRMSWTDERILAVGMYIDPELATKELDTFHGRDAKSLYEDHQFYDHLLHHTTFRRSFVVTARKRVSKSVLTALIRDELGPRIGANAAAVQTFLGFIEKSLKKAESMVLRIHEDGRFEYRLRGQLYPPIASHGLCKSIQALFFDSNSIQHDAKRGLVERLPSLWGGEVLDAQDEIFGSVHERKSSVDSDDDDDSDSDDSGDDSEAGDLFGAAEDELDYMSKRNGQGMNERRHDRHGRLRIATKVRTNSLSKRHSRTGSSDMKDERATKDEWADYDDEELEVMRRESRSLVVHFGPMVDRRSDILFSGDLAADGSALLGTWSHDFSMPLKEIDELHDSRQYRFTVGLYVDPGAITEALLKYKGLSIGSIVQDTDYFRQFSQGKFRKHLVFKVDATMKLHVLLEYLSTRLQSLVASFEEIKQPIESLVDLWHHAYPQQQQLDLCPNDEIRIAIAADQKVVLLIKKRGSFKDVKKPTHSVSSTALTSSQSEEISATSIKRSDSAATIISRADSSRESSLPYVGHSFSNTEIELMLPPPPFYLALESLFFGFHAIDPLARTQLMERVPNLLDLARDDLVHTYHDEIQALRENYKRQKPENRVKVGYLSISFDKRKLQRIADKGGAKQVTIVPSRWSKRWCRLDGTLFSYYSHKRSRKYREMMELTRCEVVEITGSSGPDVARFALDKGENDSIRIAIIKPNGEILALRTETIYEGEEWLESLTDASKVRRQAGATDNWKSWDATFAKLRRSSNSQDQLPGLGPSSGSTSAYHSERCSSIDQGVNVPEPPAVIEDGDDYDSDEEIVGKEGSLLAWVREDSRHAAIAFLLVVVVYLVSVMHRNHFVFIETGEPTHNS